MKRTQIARVLAGMLMVSGLMVTGCAETETTALGTDGQVIDGQESTPVSVVKGECCQQKTTAEGCCRKCSDKSSAGAELVSNESACCGNCEACSGGDSTKCKCAADESMTVEAIGTVQPETKEVTAEKRGHHGQTADFQRDREVFQFLLANNDKLKREVTELENGIETLTESTDMAIVEKLQEHVAAMYSRVENGEPIRMRDPLYREVFKHVDKIEMKLENTDNGVRVIETSDDEYVVKLIQAHAKVVSGFVEHGFEEARKNHDAPER